MFDFDLLTIGAGSGGVAGSRRAASYGARVGIIEKARIGGTCVLRGCVPKKLLIYGVEMAGHIEDSTGYGWSIDGARLDWSKLIAAKDRELDRLHEIYVGMLDRAGVKMIDGEARLIDAHTVEVASPAGLHAFTAERIMIATGGWPTLPDVPGAELGITSNEALELPAVPKRVTIVGGGYIAVEFAGIFRAAGAEVDLVIRADRVLRGFDEEVRDHLQAALIQRGIKIHSGVKLDRLERADGALRLRLAGAEAIDTDLVLWATGRAPNTARLGLDAAGVALRADGAIAVDESSRTSVKTIYAVGDVTDRMALTPVAIAEARAVAETLYNANPITVSYRNVPTAVFSQPPVATVGWTEEQARRALPLVDVYTARFRPMKNILAGRDEKILMKLIVDVASDRVVGAHMVGPDAAEIMQGLGVALTAGATKRDFDRTIGIHPSAAEEFVTMREPRRETGISGAAS